MNKQPYPVFREFTVRLPKEHYDELVELSKVQKVSVDETLLVGFFELKAELKRERDELANEIPRIVNENEIGKQ